MRPGLVASLPPDRFHRDLFPAPTPPGEDAPRRRGDFILRSASSRRPWYARARALFSSICDVRSSRRRHRSRTDLKVVALEDRVYPSITPLGEFGPATTTANDQQYPAVAADAAGNFLTVWQGPRPG